MKISIFVIIMIVTIANVAILPSLITGSLNTVMAQGQNITAGNLTETESITTIGEIGHCDTSAIC